MTNSTSNSIISIIYITSSISSKFTIKFRNKIGIDVMSEVLRNYFQRADRNIVRLESYARELRLCSVLEKYMEVEL